MSGGTRPHARGPCTPWALYTVGPVHRGPCTPWALYTESEGLQSAPKSQAHASVWGRNVHSIHGIRETGARCIQGQVGTESFHENIAHMESPSTVVGWKSTSGHTVQKSGVKKTKLTRCGQKRLFNHLKLENLNMSTIIVQWVMPRRS